MSNETIGNRESTVSPNEIDKLARRFEFKPIKQGFMYEHGDVMFIIPLNTAETPEQAAKILAAIDMQVFDNKTRDNDMDLTVNKLLPEYSPKEYIIDNVTYIVSIDSDDEEGDAGTVIGIEKK